LPRRANHRHERPLPLARPRRERLGRRRGLRVRPAEAPFSRVAVAVRRRARPGGAEPGDLGDRAAGGRLLPADGRPRRARGRPANGGERLRRRLDDGPQRPEDAPRGRTAAGRLLGRAEPVAASAGTRRPAKPSLTWTPEVSIARRAPERPAPASPRSLRRGL